MISKWITIATCLMLGTATFSQQVDFYNEKEAVKAPDPKSPIYIGFGTGLNAPTGLLGLSMESFIIPNIGIIADIGIGGWGYKIGLSGSYYFNTTRKSKGINFGLAAALGANDFEFETEAIFTNPLTGSETTDVYPLVMDLLPAYTGHLAYTSSRRMGKKARFLFNAGIALSLNPNAYRIKDPNFRLTTMSEGVIRALQPGGVYLGWRFMFGG